MIPSSPRLSGRDSLDIFLLLLIIGESTPVFTMKDGAGCKFFSGTEEVSFCSCFCWVLHEGAINCRKCLCVYGGHLVPFVLDSIVVTCSTEWLQTWRQPCCSDLRYHLMWCLIPPSISGFYFWFGGYCINIHSGG